MKRWPIYDEEQISDVVEVLRSAKVNAWTGDHVSRFEEAYAGHLGRRHAIAVANGTVALDLALRVLGIGPGDEVIVTPRSFMASAACVPFAGATPIFADVDPVSGNLTAETIARRITPRTRAVIPVHLAGWPCDMDPIMRLARRRGLKVIEDCAQAHGALYDGRPVGSFGDIAAFSFCQDKIITTGGEGGLVALDDDDLWQAAWSLKDHGKSYALAHQGAGTPGFRWLHESIGTNWRMMSIQAVLGLRQLARLDDWRKQRERNARIWMDGLRGLSLVSIPELPSQHTHAWYRLYAYIDPARLADGWTRNMLVAGIAGAGVPCFSGSCSEIYLEKAFASAHLGPAKRLPVARRLGERSLAFLVDPSWSAEETKDAVAVARDVIERATREAVVERPLVQLRDLTAIKPVRVPDAVVAQGALRAPLQGTAN